ncbi:MAG: proton-conducting transporter membrane subunit [Caulobacteraceae bacterium]
MSNELLGAGAALWLLAALVALVFSSAAAPRFLLALGCAVCGAGAVLALPDGASVVHLPLGIAGAGTDFVLTPGSAWLLLFGLIAAMLATWLGAPSPKGRAAWCFGAAASLIGALGVFGVQDGVSFLVAWELMGLGGALMILSESLARDSGRPVLFMLALLEVGGVALMVAFLVLAPNAHGFAFSNFAGAVGRLTSASQFVIAVLLLVGFGAKLGLLPFYEWFPETYQAASGATGALLSGIILNAAFFALARGLTEWLPLGGGQMLSLFDGIVVAVAVVSSILTALYAFQQEDWRGLLGFSSAENGSIAVALLGASLVFGRAGLGELAGLAFIVALLHLAGHSLAKSGLFLAADGFYRASGSYGLRQSGLLRKSIWPYGLGAVFAGMSLAAMPPQAGFVSEWYLFQTMFQGFHLPSLGDRLLLVMAGAGVALTVAIALATFVKVLGIGLLGRGREFQSGAPITTGLAVGLLGFCVLALAAGMPVWLSGLAHATPAAYASDAPEKMRDGWMLVPLSSKFAFLSPSALVIAMPLLALVPLLMLALSWRGAARKAPVWYGGREQNPTRVATTALSFSNALRTFYSFVYRPTAETTREMASDGAGRPYFIRRLIFAHDVAPIFGPLLFGPIEHLIKGAATRLRALQSGRLDFYLALIGLLLIGILIVALL